MNSNVIKFTFLYLTISDNSKVYSNKSNYQILKIQTIKSIHNHLI